MRGDMNIGWELVVRRLGVYGAALVRERLMRLLPRVKSCLRVAQRAMKVPACGLRRPLCCPIHAAMPSLIVPGFLKLYPTAAK